MYFMTKPLKTFDITGRLKLMVQVTIKADSLEDALAQSKSLAEKDFVSFKGEFMDGSLAIIGVSTSGSWNVNQDDKQ
jgi:hypothetical protein